MQQPLLSQTLPGQHGPAATPHFMHDRTDVPAIGAQTVPASVHVVLLQQAWPVLPHSQRPAVQVPACDVPGITHAANSATQRAEEQQADPLHVLFAQQGLPATPQSLQVFASQTTPVPVQMLPGQHGSPAPPHFMHWPAVEQTVIGSLQVPPTELLVGPRGQHAWPALPHAQVPWEHEPKLAAVVWQAWLSPTQRPAKQQPLPAQLEPSQQGCPGCPHAVQTELEQTEPLWHRGAVAQQIAPGAPHGMHICGAVVEQRVPAAQIVPQHGIPAVPHAEHCPLEHVPPVAPHAVPVATQLPAEQHAPPEQVLVVGQQASPAEPQWAHTPVELLQ
jgi:hypothetical protein